MMPILEKTENLRVDIENTAGCFSGETIISLASHEKRSIRDMKIGDEVLSINFDRGEQFIMATISSVFESIVDRCLIINENLWITEYHLLSVNDKWQRAKDLKLNDQLRNVAGSTIFVRSLRIVEEEIKVYNLFLNPVDAPFFANGYLVQNMAGGIKNPDGSLNVETQSKLSVMEQNFEPDLVEGALSTRSTSKSSLAFSSLQKSEISSAIAEKNSEAAANEDV